MWVSLIKYSELWNTDKNSFFLPDCFYILQISHRTGKVKSGNTYIKELDTETGLWKAPPNILPTSYSAYYLRDHRWSAQLLISYFLITIKEMIIALSSLMKRKPMWWLYIVKCLTDLNLFLHEYIVSSFHPFYFSRTATTNCGRIPKLSVYQVVSSITISWRVWKPYYTYSLIVPNIVLCVRI